jgi:hypothetical protein
MIQYVFDIEEEKELQSVSSKEVQSNVYITWNDNSLGSSYTFFKRSTYRGAHFGSNIDLCPASFIVSVISRPNAQLDAISSNVYVVWTNDNGDIAVREILRKLRCG